MREEELEIAIKVKKRVHFVQNYSLNFSPIYAIGSNCGEWRSWKEFNDSTVLQGNVHERL